MIRKTFYLSEDEFDFLASIDDITTSEHIRRAITSYIEKLKEIRVSHSSSTNPKIKKLNYKF